MKQLFIILLLTFSLLGNAQDGGYYLLRPAATSSCPSDLLAPNSIDSLEAWWKADAGVTGTTSVSAWADQSGNGNNLTAITGKNPALISSAINGLPVMRFSGAQGLTGGDILDLRTTSKTVFLVCKKNSTADGAFFAKSLLATGIGRYGMYHESSFIRAMAADNLTADGVYPVYSNALTSYTIVGIVYNRDKDSIKLYINGAFVAGKIWNHTPDANTTYRFLVGCYNSNPDTGETLHLNGDIAELCLHRIAFSDCNIAALTAYFKQRYNIP